MRYTMDQWMLFFFFYSLCGWVWESCYVSARQHRWVDRGFLRGPMLPIYGSGAIIILWATLPVRSSPVLIFLCGMLAATVLEYFTGAAMESLFKVRYWDYSDKAFNLNGHICLFCSLGWGAFSLLLVKLIHPPVERLLLRVPSVWAAPLALGLTALTTVDAVQSVRAALDLRELLTRLTEENEDLRRLAKRAEVFSAFAEEDLRRFRERTEVESLLLRNSLEAGHARMEKRRVLRRLELQNLTEETLHGWAAAKLQALENVSENLRAHLDRLDETRELAGEALAQRRAEIGEALETIRAREAAIRTRTDKLYRQSMRILRANPSAKAREYGDALENLRRAGGMRRD